MLKRWRRRRRLAKVKPGDGRRLKPFHWWDAIHLSVFVLDPEGERTEPYAVRADFFDLDETIELYRDGVQAEVAMTPAAFAVPGGVIEVEMSTFGLKRAHFVRDDGTEQVLRPVPGSAEHGRARFGRRYPVLSRVIGWVAILILLAGLVVAVPAALEQITRMEWVAEHIGRFTSPWSLPDGVGEALTIAGIVAALERAITLRNHWLIDADTWWL